MLGFYAIHEEKLHDLDGNTLRSLDEAGFLEPIYMSVASVGRVMELVDRKSALLG